MIKFEVGKTYDDDTSTIVARTDDQVTVLTVTGTTVRPIEVAYCEVRGIEVEYIALRGELDHDDTDILYADGLVLLWDEDAEAA